METWPLWHTYVSPYSAKARYSTRVNVCRPPSCLNSSTGSPSRRQSTQPYWLQTLEIIILCDVGIYWGHRLSHQVNFLWRFHKIHHTAESLDWMAAYREHPLDNIYTRVIENLPALLLGFPLETIAGFILFRGLWGLFIHSNVNITMGPLAWLIGSPRLHHWHHERRSSGMRSGCLRDKCTQK